MNSKTAVAVGLAAILATVAFTTTTPPQPSFAQEVQVTITSGSSTKTDDAFDPNPVEVNVGDTVTWTNDDTAVHTVVSGDGETATPSGLFESPILSRGRTFSFTFEEAGEVPYYCSLHPNMVGTVIVAEGTTGGGGDGGEPQPEPEPEPIMLEGTSSNGEYMVEVQWTSADIGEENTFNVTIFDAAGEELTDVTYDIMLLRGDQHLDETHREDQTAREQAYIFDQEGNYTLRIEDIDGTGEGSRIDIPMQVVPEFPLGVFALMAAVFGAVIFATRSKKLQLQKFF